MASASKAIPSSTWQMLPGHTQRPVSKRQVRQFLLAFANRSWSEPKNPDLHRSEFNWFNTHRIFARLLPAPLPSFPGIPEAIRTEFAWQNFALWRARLRDIWSRAQVLGEAATKEKLLQHALWYSGVGLSPTYQGKMAVRIAKARPSEGFLRVLFGLRDMAGRMRRCENRKCGAPFFFSSRERRNYCSRACTRIGELERKKRAWHKHKREWRPPKKKAHLRKSQKGEN